MRGTMEDMSGEVLLLLLTLADIAIVFFAARRGVPWLWGVIALNLILVSFFGTKLISILGVVTNIGNIFYACVFLATYFAMERYGKEEGMRLLGFGVACIASLVALSYLAIHLPALPSDLKIQDAFETLFPASLRIALASAVAYFFAQYANVFLYYALSQKTRGGMLWFRANAASVLSQLIDSLLFFSIAFPEMQTSLLLQAILAGWFYKTLIVFAATPLLYLGQPAKNPHCQ